MFNPKFQRIAQLKRISIIKNKLKILPNSISSIHKKTRNKANIAKENIILSVGRLSHQKGQEIAIKAFAHINPKDWELHIVGEGPKREEYEMLINQLRMKDNIKLIGRNRHISEYYLKSGIFIFPSRFEGFPNALTEAMFMELPCISADCPRGPSELITDNENCFLVPIDDSKLLATKIKELIANETLRREMGCKEAKSVVHLTELMVVSQWKELIDQTFNS